MPKMDDFGEFSKMRLFWLFSNTVGPWRRETAVIIVILQDRTVQKSGYGLFMNLLFIQFKREAREIEKVDLLFP